MRLVGPIQIFLEYSSHKGPTGSQGTPDTVRCLFVIMLATFKSHTGQRILMAATETSSGSKFTSSGIFC